MGLPFYQIEAYQKAPQKVKHTGITQKSPNWSWQLENIKCLQKNSTKSTKVIRILEQLCRIEKLVFQSTRWKCAKRPRPKSNISTLLKNPQIGSNNWKTSKVCKKAQKYLKKC